MEISYRDLRDNTILMLKGDIDYLSVRDLKDAILALMHEKTKHIILDLDQVYYMDSAGMGMLVNINKELIKNNGKISLLNVSDDIFDLLKLATIDKIIPIYNDEDEIA